MLSERGLGVWTIVHFALSMTWYLAVLIAQTNVLWFMSGSLVFTHGVTFLLLSASANKELTQRAAGMVLGCALFAQLAIGCYSANLFYAKYHPDTRVDAPLTRQLAHAMWEQTPATPILVLVLLGCTALLHIADVVVAGNILCAEEDEAEEREAEMLKLPISGTKPLKLLNLK